VAYLQETGHSEHVLDRKGLMCLGSTAETRHFANLIRLAAFLS
jgi:hypothetical protein